MAFIATMVFSGCNSSPQSASKADKDDHAHEAGAHPEEGPHHGHLIELGQEEYHAELTHDDATKTVSIYLLDKEAKESVAIADVEIVLNIVVDSKPLQVKLAAAPQDGDAAGKSSRFSIVNEDVLEALEAPTTTGRLNVSIGGKSYVGKVEHHDHEKKK
jgi:hypothetical protein